MVKVSRSFLIALAVLLGVARPVSAQVQKTPGSPAEFRLWEFDEISHTCRAKGRLQDRDYCASKMMDQIVAQGKAAVPILISQLTDIRRTSEPIYDYWSYTTAGDIAYFILNDLFTDSDWTTFNMPGLETLNEKCDDAAETCWRRFLTKHGRKFVQDRWLAAWNGSKERVYWDETARCFRLSPKTK